MEEASSQQSAPAAREGVGSSRQLEPAGWVEGANSLLEVRATREVVDRMHAALAAEAEVARAAAATAGMAVREAVG